jgi:YspA, cpYpsA-related SLOG family
MRILVCGDRNWTDPDPIAYALQELLSFFGPFELVEGASRGADQLARVAAKRLGLGFIEYPAEWTRYGLAAGPIRNETMLVAGGPSLVLAFHNRLQFSKGTRDMIDRSQAAGLHVILYTHERGFCSLPKCFR